MRVLVFGFAVSLAMLSPACASTEARVIRYAARERGCTETDTRLVARQPPGGWRLNVCGTERLYAEAQGRIWEIPTTVVDAGAHAPERRAETTTPESTPTTSCAGGVTTTGHCCTQGCACGGSCIDCSRHCHH